mmetsp:Transcript_26107/g.52353  ORF Transcript_26107/g.52353 Transcript_26107/m.52353 type:complete len:303 (-) Transcript_26107:65-973(-)
MTFSELRLLEANKDRVHVAFLWIHKALVARHKRGGLDVPAPILPRLIHELTNAWTSFVLAANLANTNFPVAYAQITLVQVCLLVFTTPVVIAMFTAAPGLAAIYTFFAVGSAHALAELAVDLERPFAGKLSSLWIRLMHDQFNRKLETLSIDNSRITSGYEVSDGKAHRPPQKTVTQQNTVTKERTVLQHTSLRVPKPSLGGAAEQSPSNICRGPERSLGGDRPSLEGAESAHEKVSIERSGVEEQLNVTPRRPLATSAPSPGSSAKGDELRVSPLGERVEGPDVSRGEGASDSGEMPPMAA